MTDEQINSGQPEALLKHAPFIRALARGLIQDLHSAEDVAQDTWLVALEQPPRSTASPRAWLAKVAQHLAGRQQYRAAQRRRRELRAAVPESVRSVAEIAARESVRRQVVDAVFRLHEPYRSAILLRFYDDLPPREIARRLEIPVETVKTRIQRGLKQLRAELDRTCSGGRNAWIQGLIPFVGLAPGLSSSIVPVHTSLVVLGGALMNAKWIVGTALLIATLAVFSLMWSGDETDLGYDTDHPLGSRHGAFSEYATAASQGDEKGLEIYTRQAVPASSLSIRGSLRDDEDQPLAGVHCLLLDGRGKTLTSTLSDPIGSFACRTAVGSGYKSLVFHGEGWVPRLCLVDPAVDLPPSQREPQTPMADQGVIRLEPAGTLDIQFGTGDGQRLPPVTVVVRDELDNPLRAAPDGILSGEERAALEKIMTALPYPPWLAMPRTLETGHIRCIVPAGRLSIRAQAHGYPELESDLVEVPRGITVPLYLEFSQPLCLEGVCLGWLDGKPRPGVPVAAWPILTMDYNLPVSLQAGATVTSIEQPVSVLKSSGPSGITVLRPLKTVTDENGCFRFYPVPPGSRYCVVCTEAAFSKPQILDDFFAAGTRDIRLYVKAENTSLLLEVWDEQGRLVESGEGLALIQPLYENCYFGSPYTLPLSQAKTKLPLRGDGFSDVEALDMAQITVWWQPDRFGSLYYDLKKMKKPYTAKVTVKPGVRYDLGLGGFSIHSMHLAWSRGKKTHPEELVLGSEVLLPSFLDPLPIRPAAVLGRTAEDGAYWIAAARPGMEQAVLWLDDFRRIYVTGFDPADDPPMSRYAECMAAEKITLRLANEQHLRPGDQIRCELEARMPGRCGKTLLGRWIILLSGTPGKRPHVWPEKSFRYTPPPGASITLLRPKGLEYSLVVLAEPEKHDDGVLPRGRFGHVAAIMDQRSMMISEEIICDEEVEIDAVWGAEPQGIVAERIREPKQAPEPTTSLLLNKRFVLDRPRSFTISVPGK